MTVREIYKEFNTTGKFLFCKIISDEVPNNQDQYREVLNEIDEIKERTFQVIRSLSFDSALEFKYDLIDHLNKSKSIQVHSKYKIVISDLINYILSINKEKGFDLEKLLQANLNSDINTKIFFITEWDTKRATNWERRLDRYLNMKKLEVTLIEKKLKSEIEILKVIYENYIAIYKLLEKEKYRINLNSNYQIDLNNYSNNIHNDLTSLRHLTLKLIQELNNNDKNKWDNTRFLYLEIINQFLIDIEVNHNNDFKKTNYYKPLENIINLLESIDVNIFHKNDILDEIPNMITTHPKLNRNAKIALHILARDIEEGHGSKTELNSIYFFLKQFNAYYSKTSIQFEINYSEFKKLIKGSYNLKSAEKDDNKLYDRYSNKFKCLLSENEDFDATF